MSKRLKVLFGLSLLLNLVIIGCVIGFALRWNSGDGMRFAAQAMRSHVFEHIIEDIPEAEIRTELQQRFLTLKSENRVHAATIRQSRKKMRQIVEAEPFDEAAYHNSIHDILEAKRATEYSYAMLLSEVIKALPIDDREDVLKWLYRGGGKKKRHRDHN